MLLLVLLPLLALSLRRTRSSSICSSRLINYRSSTYRNEHKFSGRNSRWRTALDVIYMLLVVAALLMSKFSRPYVCKYTGTLTLTDTLFCRSHFRHSSDCKIGTGRPWRRTAPFQLGRHLDRPRPYAPSHPRPQGSQLDNFGILDNASHFYSSGVTGNGRAGRYRGSQRH